jgi:hypothetical protein
MRIQHRSSEVYLSHLQQALMRCIESSAVRIDEKHKQRPMVRRAESGSAPFHNTILCTAAERGGSFSQRQTVVVDGAEGCFEKSTSAPILHLQVQADVIWNLNLPKLGCMLLSWTGNPTRVHRGPSIQTSHSQMCSARCLRSPGTSCLYRILPAFARWKRVRLHCGQRTCVATCTVMTRTQCELGAARMQRELPRVRTFILIILLGGVRNH